MPKFTKRFVEAITPDPVKTLKLWDSELKGFGLVVLPSGRRTYCIEYRNSDRIKKRLKIGVHGIITTEEARDLAKKSLDELLLEKTRQNIKNLLLFYQQWRILVSTILSVMVIKKDQRVCEKTKNCWRISSSLLWVD